MKPNSPQNLIKQIKNNQRSKGGPHGNQKEKFNTCCPYCHSHRMIVDANVIISGKLTEHNQIQANEYWTPETLTEESIAESIEEDIQGYCHNCNSYCDFSWKKDLSKAKGSFTGFP